MSADPQSFSDNFFRLTGHSPMRWQHRLFDQFIDGKIPAALDLPTGLGKTSVMAIWVLARALATEIALKTIPRRLVYVVDRRAVVDQATAEAEKLRTALEADARHLKEQLQLDGTLPISTLRGAYVDNREWLDDPAALAIIVGTVDMIGSRLLFEGYGVSRKMRPYHAGLLGADTLVVLDEAHLVPPFANLLRAIEGDPSLWPEDRTPLPRFIVLPLSATQRERPAEDNGRKPFGLEEEDWRDDTASQRLNARKQLRIEPLAEKDHDRQLAEAAFALATKDQPTRVLVFCSRREKKDDGVGPSAQGVAEAIEALAKGDKKAGREKIDIEPPELLVGARRVHEREQVARRLQELGFIGHKEPPERPTFLVATSAGEVGVDLDADHLVCDLVPWERMVQRLGRVNRRGGEGREAHVVVFDTSGVEKDEPQKKRLIVARDLLGRIETDFGGKAGPATLLELRGRIGRQEIEKASTPEPLHPALTRALVDAWSMTSLEQHTGRSEVAPWLRGWVEPDYQTTVIWRVCLPVREGAEWPRTLAEKKEVEAFFEAAPPHESEKLETETYRVADWLMALAKSLSSSLPSAGASAAEPASVESENAADDGIPTADAATAMALKPLRRDDIVAYVLSLAGDYSARYTLNSLADERNKKLKEQLNAALSGTTLIVDARFGGIEKGMLSTAENGRIETADADRSWSERAGFRVRPAKREDYESKDKEWRFEDDFVLRRDESGEALERLIVEHYKSAAQSEEGRSVSRQPQELVKHQCQAEEKARYIGERLGLCGVALEVLTLAARLHDEGKRAEIWQKAFRASRDAAKCGLTGPLAKTTGYLPGRLNGYRHEFGSLAVFDRNHEWRKDLPPDVKQRVEDLERQPEWFDLLQHLIAAHHGGARPTISTDGCEDAPPSAFEERARAVALRFARLQRRWGPWGLAWWEALLRAADQQASRDNDRREGLGAPHAEEK
jgi:CRISPR-associated endonuclease/helicase Cas3